MEGHYKKLAVTMMMMMMMCLLVVAMEAKSSVPCYMTKKGLKACKLAAAAKNPTKPSAGCCGALATTDLSCFCELMKTYSKDKSSGISFERAKKIPGICTLYVPSECA